MPVDHRMWKPIKLSRGGPALSHLAFADNLVLFSKASLDQVKIIKACLGYSAPVRARK